MFKQFHKEEFLNSGQEKGPDPVNLCHSLSRDYSHWDGTSQRLPKKNDKTMAALSASEGNTIHTKQNFTEKLIARATDRTCGEVLPGN